MYNYTNNMRSHLPRILKCDYLVSCLPVELFAMKVPFTCLLFLICLVGCSQNKPQERTYVPAKHAPLRNYFGVNAFEWDFSNPPDALNLDAARLNAVKSFTGVRHYLD